MNSYSVSIDPDAQIKIEQAANWFDYRSSGRGDRFLDQVTLQLDSLKENPQRHAIRYRDVRRVPMKSHAFTIHYCIDESQKIVFIRDFIDTRRGPNHHPRRT